MANIRNIQFLRNSTLYASLEAAKADLTSKAVNALDGSPLLGRYSVQTGATASDTEVRTVLGLVYNGTVTFFNNEKEIDNILDGLDYSGITTSNAAVVTNVTEANGMISATSENIGNLVLTDYVQGSDSGAVEATDTINEATAKLQNQIDATNDALEALDAESVSGDSKVVIDVTQEDGLITATAENLTNVKLDGLTTGTDAKIASTDTLGEALANIQAQIDAMDKNADAVDGKVVTTVTEVDGKVTETKANVKDLQLGGYERTNDIGEIESADTINVALSKLENQITSNDVYNADGSISVVPTVSGTEVSVVIKEGEKVLAKDGGNGLYTDLDFVKITTGLPEEIKERYQLLATDDSQIGVNIDIPKDSHIVSINYISTSGDPHYQCLEYVYLDVSGETKTEYVDMSQLVLEAEFASGVTVTDGVAHGVVDPTTEKVIVEYNTTGNTLADVLTVGEDGFKVANIQDAIDAAVGKATTEVALTDDTVEGTAVEVNEHVTLSSATADNGKVTYTIHTNDIASQAELDEEVARAISAETALDGVIGCVKTAGSEERTYTKTNTVYATGSTVVSDVELLDAAVAELSGKSVTDFTSENNSIDIVTAETANGTISVDLQTDADKISGLTAVADSDEGLAKISGVSETDSVKTAISNLYDSIKSEVAARKAAISNRTISGSSAIAVTETPDGDGFESVIELVLDEVTTGIGNEKTGTNNALTITNDGLFLSTTWECGTFDE